MKPESFEKLHMDDCFEPALLFGKFCMFTDRRVDRSTVPLGLYVYELRHRDDDWCTPCEILPHVLCNFMGTILVDEKIPVNFSDVYVNVNTKYDPDDGYCEEPDFDNWDSLSNFDDDDLWDNLQNIPTNIIDYIEYQNDTGWDIPNDRLEKRDPPEDIESIQTTLGGDDDDM